MYTTLSGEKAFAVYLHNQTGGKITKQTKQLDTSLIYHKCSLSNCAEHLNMF